MLACSECVSTVVWHSSILYSAFMCLCMLCVRACVPRIILMHLSDKRTLHWDLYIVRVYKSLKRRTFGWKHRVYFGRRQLSVHPKFATSFCSCIIQFIKFYCFALFIYALTGSFTPQFYQLTLKKSTITDIERKQCE